MGTRFEDLNENHIQFISEQSIFFVSTAPLQGRINLSPKGMDTLRVLSANRILWLNLTGSGNETAPHLAHDPRITLMWCCFGARPLILRAYGTARALHRGHPDWANLAAMLPDQPGARQIMDCTLDLVQASCGYAVPEMVLKSERTVLRDWATKKGDSGLLDYWAERNTHTIDGAPSGMGAEMAEHTQ